MARRAKLVLMGPSTLNSQAYGDGVQTGNGNAFDWQGGDGFLMAEATWNAATLNLQMQNDNGTWINIQNYATTTAIALTANGSANFRAPAGKMRVVAGAATAVIATVIGVPSTAAG